MALIIFSLFVFAAGAIVFPLPLSALILAVSRWSHRVRFGLLEFFVIFSILVLSFASLNLTTFILIAKIIEFFILLLVIKRFNFQKLSRRDARTLLYVYLLIVAGVFLCDVFGLIRIQENIFGLLVLPCAIVSVVFNFRFLAALCIIFCFACSAYTAFVALTFAVILRHFSLWMLKLTAIVFLFSVPILALVIDASPALESLLLAINFYMPTLGIRFALWVATFNEFKHFGIGQLVFGDRSHFDIGFYVGPEIINFSPFTFLGNDPHNIFLNLFSFTGLWGVFCYSIIIISLKSWPHTFVATVFTIYWTAEPSLGSVQLYSILICFMFIKFLDNYRKKHEIIAKRVYNV